MWISNIINVLWIPFPSSALNLLLRGTCPILTIFIDYFWWLTSYSKRRIRVRNKFTKKSVLLKLLNLLIERTAFNVFEAMVETKASCNKPAKLEIPLSVAKKERTEKVIILVGLIEKFSPLVEFNILTRCNLNSY